MLQKDNIVLRAPELADVDFLYLLENDNRLWHLSNTLRPFSHFDLEQFILQSEKDIFAAGQARFIIEKVDGKKRKIVGAIDLFAVEAKHRRAGIGIIVVEEERGKGLASTALDILIDYAFTFLNLHQLYCNIEASNEKSLQLFETKGFLSVGKKIDWNMHNGAWVDEFLLQLINQEKR
ncbi:MAG: GNAT family N-acetyltransferase [Bacteroidetes bacterium]|nr:MAG: GNAT family N-acetyltransferase [Bacteroidota bacterium]